MQTRPPDGGVTPGRAPPKVHWLDTRIGYTPSAGAIPDRLEPDPPSVDARTDRQAGAYYITIGTSSRAELFKRFAICFHVARFPTARPSDG